MFFGPPIMSAQTRLVTWSTTDLGPSIALSGGDLTATSSASTAPNFRSVRATVSRNTSAHRFEVVAGSIAGSGASVGISNATFPVASGPNNWLGSSAGNGIGFVASGGCYMGGTLLGATDAYASGDTLAIEVDLNNSLIYFQRLGGSRSAGFSFSALTGPFFPTFTFIDNATSAAANFGASTFAVTPTSGFSGWNRG